MKVTRIAAMLLTVAMVLMCFAGCNAVEKAREEIITTFDPENYYPEELEMINALVDECMMSIEEEKDKSKIKSYTDECIDAIGEIDQKDEAMAAAKAEAEKFFEAIDGKIVPYESAVEITKGLFVNKEIMEKPSTAGELRNVIVGLSEYAEGVSDKGVYECTVNGVDLEFECEASVDENGSFIVTLTCNEEWERLTEISDFIIETGSYCESPLSNYWGNNCVTLNTIFGYKNIGMYYTIENGTNTRESVADPEKARVSYKDANTMLIEVATPEQLDVVLDDSKTFVDAFGQEVTREWNLEDCTTFVPVMIVFDFNDYMTENTQWVIYL